MNLIQDQATSMNGNFNEYVYLPQEFISEVRTQLYMNTEKMYINLNF
jgi:hypothetical protein